jgi:hypothetical protein
MSQAYKNIAVSDAKTARFKNLLISSWHSLIHLRQACSRHNESPVDDERLPYTGVRPSPVAQSFDMLVESDVVRGTHSIV